MTKYETMILARLVGKGWDSIRFFLYVNHAGLRGFRINIYNISSGTECSASLMAAHCGFFSAWPGVYFFRGVLFWENMKTVQFRFLRAQTSRHTKKPRVAAWSPVHKMYNRKSVQCEVSMFRHAWIIAFAWIWCRLHCVCFFKHFVVEMHFYIFLLKIQRPACLVVIFPRLPGLPVEIATVLNMQRLGHSLT